MEGIKPYDQYKENLKIGAKLALEANTKEELENKLNEAGIFAIVNWTSKEDSDEISKDLSEEEIEEIALFGPSFKTAEGGWVTIIQTKEDGSVL